MVGVTMNYRLAPDDLWPAGAEDVGTVVKWLSSNLDTYGGDPGRIVVAEPPRAPATSQGAWLVRRGQSNRDSGGDPAVWCLRRAGRDGIRQAEAHGTDLLRHRRGAVSRDVDGLGCAASRVPTLIGVAELDPPPMHEHAWLLMTRLYLRNRRIPPSVWAPGHNHLSYVLGLGVEDDSVLDDAGCRFIADIMDA
jgi:alpha/beta hydrolase fold